MSTDETSYYARHGVESDPGDLRPLLDALPTDPADLVDAVGGLILDRAFAGPFGGVFPPDSADDAERRRMSAMLARIVERDASSLAPPRPPVKRLVGACRHGSTPRLQRAAPSWRTRPCARRLCELFRAGLPR